MDRKSTALKLVDSPTERTTAATDVILCAAAAGAATYLQMLPQAWSGRAGPWSWSFGLIALSAGCGAAYHGLFLADAVRRGLWHVLTACLGMAISLFVVAVLQDVGGTEAAHRALPIMLAASLLIFGISRLFPGLFIVFILYQTLALLTAFAAYTWMAALGTLSGAGWIAAGVLISMIAAGIQTRRHLQVNLVWEFDHNGMFHLVQVFGLVLICVGLSRG
ncbi:MAG: DUF6962 family protein [Hyphomicrobiales bacterium]